jgi:hypothetical protein
MSSVLSGEPDRPTTVPECRDTTLAQERLDTDSGLETERTLLDSALDTLGRGMRGEKRTAADRSLLVALSNRIRSQRQQIDEKRRFDRRATDTAMDDERHARETVEKTLSERALKAESTADLEIEAHERDKEEWDEDRRDASERLWLILPEIDIIATAINEIRLDTFDRPSGSKIFHLASAVEVATQRILDLIGELLDPSDHDQRYHEEGGSG